MCGVCMRAHRRGAGFQRVALADVTMALQSWASCSGPHPSLLPPTLLASAPAHIQVLIEPVAARKAAMCLI